MKNYTSLHTPLHLEKLHHKVQQKAGKKRILGKFELVLIIIGIVTTVILGILVYMLYLKDAGAL
ncbi:MAG: hypothetical protein ACOCXQ_02290 [Patescibacteria group bacterium]